MFELNKKVFYFKDMFELNKKVAPQEMLVGWFATGQSGWLQRGQ